MHGSVSGYLLVNAEVDSMGGVVDSGGGIGVKTSPRRTAIEKAQAELRQEYDVREERWRELEFLEKGGNPLDFKFGIATSHSVQSISLTDRQADHFINSEVKDSFALTASPHGDSVESSGRPGVPTISEPNTADNLLLFDSENKSVEGEINLRYSNRQNRTSESEQSSKANTNQNTKETEDSAIFRPYARRNRSKINRDPARSSSTDLAQNRGGVAMSISIHRGSVDGKGYIPEAANQKDRHTTSVSCPIFANSNGNIVPKNVDPSNPLNTKVDGGSVVRESTAGSKTSLLKDKADITHKKSSACMPFEETGLAGEKALLVSSSTEIGSPKATTIVGQESNSTQVNGLRDSMVEEESLINRGAAGTKGLESESSHANNVEVDVDNERDLYRVEKLDSDEISMEKASRVEGLLNQTVGEIVKTKIEDETGRSTAIMSDCIPAHEMQMKSVKTENQSYQNTAELQNEEKCSDTEKKLQDGFVVPEKERKVDSALSENPSSSLCPGVPQASVDTNSCIVGDNVLLGADVEALNHQPSTDAIMLDTVKEDSILEEARVIQAKRKRIAELSCGTTTVEVRERSQWDFVLEEMAWLANDFAQERLWKMTAAAQICRRVAMTCQLRFEERNQHRKLKKIASILSNAILQFWSSVEVPRELEKTSMGTDKDKKRFRTRAADVVRLIDLLDEAKTRSKASLIERGKDKEWTLEELDQTAEAVGYGALKFADLKNKRSTNYTFSFDQILCDKGKTAVYLLYAHARICSIIRKSGKDINELKKTGKIALDHVEERALGLHLLQFSETVEEASTKLLPHLLCEYLYELSEQFSKFYSNCQVNG